MKKILNYKIAFALFVMIFAISCDKDQEVSPVIDPNLKPMVTFVADPSGDSFKEGDILTYTISMDKMIDNSITFSANQTGGTATEDDFTIESVVMRPYTTEATMEVVFTAFDFPDATKTLSFELGVAGVAERYLVHPTTTYPSKDLEITNVNDPGKLIIGFSWPNHDVDIDIVTWSDTPDNPLTEWGADGASGSNPEVDKSIWLADPVGTYYVNIMDWGEDAFPYTFNIGHPDGTIQIIEGVFDHTKTDYVNDLWMAWGEPGYNSYRVLKVVNDGTSFTVTKL